MTVAPRTEVLATRGSDIHLLGIGGELAVVLNTEGEHPVLSPPASIASHTKWGYWEEFTGDPAPILAAAVRAVRTGEAYEWARAVLPPDIEPAPLGR